jgi:hypothetical protein
LSSQTVVIGGGTYNFSYPNIVARVSTGTLKGKISLVAKLSVLYSASTVDRAIKDCNQLPQYKDYSLK